MFYCFALSLCMYGRSLGKVGHFLDACGESGTVNKKCLDLIYLFINCPTFPIPGQSCPRSVPVTLHTCTKSVKYFKTSNDLGPIY